MYSASVSSGTSSPAPDDVGFIMAQCSCSRRKAASALKLHKGNADAAIKSLQEAAHLTSPLSVGVRGTSPVRSKVLGNVTPVAPVSSPTPHFYYQTPESESLLPEDIVKAPSPAQKQVNTNVKLPPPPDSVAELSVSLHTKDEKPVAAKIESSSQSFGPVALPANLSEPSESTSQGFPLQLEKWDFQLPSVEIPLGEPPFSPDEGRRLPFSLARLIAALTRGLSLAQLQHYLLFFDEGVVRQGLRSEIAGIPSIFYAVASNNENIVRTWASHGCDMNAKEPRTGIPLLAFAILRTRAANEDTTTMVMTLLSLGADATVIPPSLFSPCLEDPPEVPLGSLNDASGDINTAWCRGTVYASVAKTINLSQRYFLDKVLKMEAPTSRQSQVTCIHNATALLGISYFLIGQTAATQLVSDVLISHLALPRTKPLVMAFTGPSGHGKTELAKRMGELLNLEICCVDCTEMKHETDLFGPKMPYRGYELGSPLNNFLARNTGKRCIVFLDELEKTTREVQNALLVPFSEGRYSDRRSRDTVDTSQTIWIFATNAADDAIIDFFQIHEHHLTATDDPMRRNKLIMQLTMAIKKQLKSTYGNPLSGRISVIVPFLPFSPVEAAVVAHKFVLEFKRRVFQSIRVEGKQLVGHVALDMLGDGAICKLIAEEGYDCDQGARSLQTSVETRIGDAMVRAYLEEESQIDDTSPLTRYVVSVARNGNIIVRKSDQGGQQGTEEYFSADHLRQQEAPSAQNVAGAANMSSQPVECEQEQNVNQDGLFGCKETDKETPLKEQTRLVKGKSSGRKSPPTNVCLVPKDKSTPNAGAQCRSHKDGAGKNDNDNTKQTEGQVRPDKEKLPDNSKSSSQRASLVENDWPKTGSKGKQPQHSTTALVDSNLREESTHNRDIQVVNRDDNDATVTRVKEDRIKQMESIIRSYPKDLVDKQVAASRRGLTEQAKLFPNIYKGIDDNSSVTNEAQHDIADLLNVFQACMSDFSSFNMQELRATEQFVSSIDDRTLNEEERESLLDLTQTTRSWSRDLQYAEKQTDSLMNAGELVSKMLYSPAMEKMMDFNSQSPDVQARTVEDLREELSPSILQLFGEDSEIFKGMKHVGMLGGTMMRRQMHSALSEPLTDPKDMATGPPDLKHYDAFQYEKLGDTPSIRLLFFEDRDHDNPCFIKMRIEEVALGQLPAFNALSYVWGDYRPPLLQQFNSKRVHWRFPILCNGKRIEITYNLFCCLRRLSLAENQILSDLRSMPLWIDQLCINQADDDEKSKQVAMMDEIYTASQAVLSWLGEGGNITTEAADLINDLSLVPMDCIKGPDFDPAAFVEQFSSDSWLSLGSIVARPYFKRVWIVQEIALAKKIILICGDRLLDWDKLVRALEVINASQCWQELSEYVSLFRPPDEQLLSLGMRSALRFGDELTFLIDAQKTLKGSGLSPANVLLLGLRFDATQLVDKFFAMIGMAKRGAPTPIEAAQLPVVDYSLSLKDVALSFAKYYIEHLSLTSFLALVGDAKNKTNHSHDFPSWLPDPATPLLPLPLKAEGIQFDSSISWMACGEVQKIGEPQIDQDRILLRAFKVETVDKTAMPFNIIDGTNEWHQLFDFVAGIADIVVTNGFSVGQVLWRTLTTSFDRPNAKSASTAELDQDFSNWCVSLIVAIQRHDIHKLGSSASADFVAMIQRMDDSMFDCKVFGNAIRKYIDEEMAYDFLPRSDLHRQIMEADLAGQNPHRLAPDERKPGSLLHDSLKRLYSRTGKDDIFPSPTAIEDTLDKMHEMRRGTDVYKEAFDSVERFEIALRKTLHTRCLFMTAGGRLGLGAHSIAQYDEIWILPGASVPIVLRSDGQGGHTLVGEAFVFGIMHGEAVPDTEAVILEDIILK